MAEVDKYTDANVEAGKKTNALKTGSGAKLVTLTNVVTVATADSNGSVYRVFADVPSRFVPVKITIHNTAISSGTDYDLGLYETDEGAAVDADILADGLDMSSARTIDAENNDGMTTITLADIETLAELSAQDDPSSAYDIAFTANTVGDDGTIRVTATFAYA